jgi:hypothetical protein
MRTGFCYLACAFGFQMTVVGFPLLQAFFETGNMGSSVRLVASTEVECLLVTLDVVELLTCNEPLIGLRLFRNLAMTLGRRLEGQIQALFASKGAGANVDAGVDTRSLSVLF